MKHTRMKTQNLKNAAQRIAFAVTDLRAALEDANHANEQFAWLLLETALQDAATLQRKIQRILEAAQ